MVSNYRLSFSVSLLALLLLAGCGSDSENRRNDDRDSLAPRITTDESEEGWVVERLDADGDGIPDIIRYYETFTDPREPDRLRRRLRRMELDINGDQIINVRRHYDEFGNVSREENDVNLDGEINSVLYFVGGELARKELFRQGRLTERRIYYGGALVRVERDRNGNGEVDHWEYYEDGVLMRIGRDTVGDGAADTWQLR